MAILSASVREGAVEDNGLLPVRTYRDKGHLGVGQLLQPLNIVQGIPRQICEASGPTDVLRPTVEFLIDGLALIEEPQISGYRFGKHLLLSLVTDADLQFFDAGKNIEFRQSDTGNSGNTDGMADQNHIKPAASSVATRCCSYFLPNLLKSGPGFVRQLRWKGTFADPRCVRLADPDH
jgi:hypothetical protein